MKLDLNPIGCEVWEQLRLDLPTHLLARVVGLSSTDWAWTAWNGKEYRHGHAPSKAQAVKACEDYIDS